jgi:SOS-response transcriptional repressor LexA
VRSEDRQDTKLFRTLSRSLLKGGFAIRFRARGRSMFPAISDGDVLEVQPALSSRPGDVVLLESDDDGVRAHRVIDLDAQSVITRGDACVEPDAVSHSSAVLGRVSSVVTKDGQRRPDTWRTRLRTILLRTPLVPTMRKRALRRV